MALILFEKLLPTAGLGWVNITNTTTATNTDNKLHLQVLQKGVLMLKPKEGPASRAFFRLNQMRQGNLTSFEG